MLRIFCSHISSRGRLTDCSVSIADSRWRLGTSFRSSAYDAMPSSLSVPMVTAISATSSSVISPTLLPITVRPYFRPSSRNKVTS